MAAFIRWLVPSTCCMLLVFAIANSSSAAESADQQSLAQANATIEQLQQELTRIQTLSKDAIAIDAAFRRLREENELLKVEIETLKLDNIRLAENNTARGIRWGTAAVLVGVLLAWVISQVSTRKRRDSW